MQYLNHARRVSSETGGFRMSIPPHLTWESITFMAKEDDESTCLASQSTQRTGSHSLCAL